jgi:hypothetical protein
LKRWLRYAEDLRATEDKMICYCWPETGKSLDDWSDEEDEMRSFEGLIDCPEAVESFHIARWARKQEMNWGRLMISRTAGKAEKKFQFARRTTSWDQLRISKTVMRTAKKFQIADWAMIRDH